MLRIQDSSLRDGQHAVRHQLSSKTIEAYAAAAEAAGVAILEVGHGNGLGGSSLHMGRALLSDRDMLVSARAVLRNTQLAAFAGPGWSSRKDLDAAVGEGVDILRIATHCTEADVARRHIEHAVHLGVDTQAVLLMSHMASPAEIGAQGALLASYGARSVGFLDSAGTMTSLEVTDRVNALRDATDAQIIFHGHNNLGLAVSNSIAAARAGASIIDACSGGFGAGAGNTALEQCVAVLNRMGFETGITTTGGIALARAALSYLWNGDAPIDPLTVASGVAGVFSGFRLPVVSAAASFGVDPAEVFRVLGEMRAAAGQEDLIDIAAQRVAAQRVAAEQGSAQ